jgi:hypothetical protein
MSVFAVHACDIPLIRPFGPPSPRGGEGRNETFAILPFSPTGRRCRQADEGVTHPSQRPHDTEAGR